MSEIYSPDPGVEPQDPYNTTFLSQRDLGLQVPINFVTTPGVSLTAACFPFDQYEDDSYEICMSNLLASGFRRFEVDLYWDQGRQLWSFCPVQIPTSVPNAVPTSTHTLSLSSSTLATLTSAATAFGASGNEGNVKARQTSSEPSLSSTLTISPANSSSSLGAALPSVSIIPTSNESLVSIGPFICTTTINLSSLMTLLLDYIHATQNTLSANLLYVTVNIHAAVNSSAPYSPASVPSSLPTSSDLIGNLFSGNLSAYLYTPANLQNNRANLNSSWYEVSELYRPISDYYTTETIANNIVTTEDGWPSESYIEFSKSKRLLLSWGRIDPQMFGYNMTADTGTLFPANYISNTQTDLTATSSGQLTSGCFLHNNTDDLSLVNSSWAITSNISSHTYPTNPSSDLTPLLNLTSASTSCGISTLLNTTLLNVTAAENYIPYHNTSYASIWSWAPGEPKSKFRCATISTNSRWQVSDCSQKYYAACRAVGQPYNWTVTTYTISYSYAVEACPDGYVFAAPRTALENSYLSQAMSTSKRDYDEHGVFVDFNSLDVEGCWVVGGVNATCPYKASLADMDDLEKRVILIPTIAAIIVFIVTALTVFVKAAGNRKTNERRRRRTNNEFIYEGVPS